MTSPIPPTSTPHLARSGMTHIFQRHARSILFLLSVLAIAGILGGLYLPVSLFPQVSFPRIEIAVDAGDRPAERMAIEVTYPVEEAVRAIPGVQTVRSASSRGSADISINFDWGQDMTSALLQVQSQINSITSTLPPGTSFDVQRRDPTVFPVLAYSLTSDSHSLIELRDIAVYQLRPLLSTVSGVAKVVVQGGHTEEYRVDIDAAQMHALGVTISDVAAAVSGSNVLTAVGRLEDHDKLYLIIANTQISTLNEIKRTVIRAGATGVVRLSQIATVKDSAAPEWTRVTADGHDAVLVQVYQQPGGNTVQIAKSIKQNLIEAQSRLPPGVAIANWYDQSDLIITSATSVRDAALIGIGLAAVVLWIFLGNWRIALVATLAVPAVLAMTVLVLEALGLSFNIMTLGGMAAAVGLIIDDTIVMAEHIVRRFEEPASRGANKISRVADAAAEFTRPLVGSSSSTIIIFLPLAFLSGVTGAFFKALSVTMAASLMISFLVSWLAVPILAARVLRARRAGDHDSHIEHAPGFILRGYAAIMRPLLRFPWLTIPLLALFVAAGYLAYNRVGTGFMPAMDEGGFIMDYKTDPGTSLAETDRLLRKVEAILRATPEVATYSRRTGLQLGGGLTEANTGDFFVRLKSLPRAPIEDVMDDVRIRIAHSVPGIDIETAQLMEDLIGDLTSVPEPIEIKIYSDDQSVLNTLGPKVDDAISAVRGVDEVKNGIVLAGDALDIRVDPVKAGLEGLTPDVTSKILSDLLDGNVSTQILHGVKTIGVRTWIPTSARNTDRDLGELPIKAPDGHILPLKRIATITPVTGQPEINRENLKRMIAVTARITGRDLGSTAAEIKTLLDKPGMFPSGVYYTLGGAYEQQQIAFRGLLIVIIAAVLLVFLLLLFMYERFRVAIAMLSIPLFAMSAVFMGLYLTKTELNITAMMGMTMVVGIVTEVAIFYYSEYVDLPADLSPHARLILAGQNRMRPIAMTTVAAILALLPLGLGIGQGSAMQQPLAIAILAGLTVQLPLTLIILPALLALLRIRPSK